MQDIIRQYQLYNFNDLISFSTNNIHLLAHLIQVNKIYVCMYFQALRKPCGLMIGMNSYKSCLMF